MKNLTKHFCNNDLLKKEELCARHGKYTQMPKKKGFIFYGCALLMIRFFHDQSMQHFYCLVFFCVCVHDPLLSNILQWIDEIINQHRSFRLHCEGFYVIVLHLWGHYKQIQALKGNTLTGTVSHGDAEVCTSVLFVFFIHMDSERERFNSALPCINEVKSANWFLMWKCERSETVLSFEFDFCFSVQQSIFKTTC